MLDGARTGRGNPPFSPSQYYQQIPNVKDNSSNFSIREGNDRFVGRVSIPDTRRKGCRDWNPDLLIEKLSMARLHD